MHPIDLPRRRALILPPQDVQPFILEIPRLKARLREEATGAELRKRYPGDPAATVFDAFPVKADSARGKVRRVIAFAGDRALIRSYQACGKALIPGYALLAAGARKLAGKSGLAILDTPHWVEAARFNRAGPVKLKTMAKRGASIPASFLQGLYEGPKPPQTIIIRAGTRDDPPEETRFEGLNEEFNQAVHVNADEFLPYNIGKAAVFKPKRPRRAGALFLILILPLLAGAWASLQRLAESAEARAEGLRQTKAALERRYAEADLLRRDIQAAEAPSKVPPYDLIAELHACLDDARLRSLTLQDRAFSLEADGGDAFAALRKLEGSRYFRRVQLRQAVMSGAGAEGFSLSGEVDYEAE
ncbi:MAG: hypothetical protein LBD08_04440 [Treponema sp.]|jgi:hypothetical protein|nr:hypothetical protein [Treponema sp.]